MVQQGVEVAGRPQRSGQRIIVAQNGTLSIVRKPSKQIWLNLTTAFNVTPAFRGPAVFSMTTDGGKTWSPSRIIFDPGQKNQTIDNQIVVVPTGAAKGTLVDGFTLLLTKGGKGNPSTDRSVAVLRSTDGGATWSAPVIVSPLSGDSW